MVTARWQTRHRVELPADQWSPLAGWYPTRPRSANTPVGRAQQAVTVPLVANGLAGARSTLAWAILARKPLYAVDPAVATWLAHRPVGRRGQQLSQGRGRAVRVWLEGAADHQPGTGAGTSCFHRVPSLHGEPPVPPEPPVRARPMPVGEEDRRAGPGRPGPDAEFASRGQYRRSVLAGSRQIGPSSPCGLLRCSMRQRQVSRSGSAGPRPTAASSAARARRSSAPGTSVTTRMVGKPS